MLAPDAGRETVRRAGRYARPMQPVPGIGFPVG